MKKILRLISEKFKRIFKPANLLEKLSSVNPESKIHAEKFLHSIEAGFADDSLYIVLKLLSLVFIVDKNYRKNIKNFNGRYLFNSMDNKIDAAVIFKNSRMVVKSHSINDADVTVTFRDVPSLMRFVMSKNPNILNAVLDQTIVIDGNLNYIYKFAYMVQHLTLRLKQCVKPDR